MEKKETGIIKLLDKSVSELIAAGEVVERPASAAKELLENSIDAGADAVTVEIRGGGVAYLRVTDDGCGMMPDDLPRAFLRHATSKVLNADDLCAIKTLGFRGEALASIAAVSRVTVTTRTENELAGSKLMLYGGEEAFRGEAGCPKGTTIVMRDLFYNTPARHKFLKKDVTEGNAVGAVVQRIALSHPEISIKFIKDGRQTLHTPGDARLMSAIHAVLGKEFASSLLKTEYGAMGIGVSGYVTKPVASRPNRNMQFFFINGRLVKTRTAMAALEEAYRGSIMTGKFPGCVMNIKLSPTLYDVNVHPAKLEVRFANEHSVFEAVYYAVKTTLREEDPRPVLKLGIEKDKSVPADRQPAGTALRADAAKAGIPVQTSIGNVFSRKDETIMNCPVPEQKNNAEAEKILQDGDENASACPPVPVMKYEDEKSHVPDAVAKDKDDPQENICDQNAGFKIIGQCFETYILAQKGSELFIIDKHAAHERILYEKLKKEETQSAQVLMEPVTVTLQADEYAAVLDNIDAFRRSGFGLEDFGGSAVIVREAPLNLTGQDVGGLVSEIAGDLIARKKDIMPRKLDWIYHSVACRAAIKAGDITSRPEMERLVWRVFESENVRYCPHGRPVAFSIPRSELEKRFGRAE